MVSGSEVQASPALAISPYATRYALLTVLLMADASINATVDAQIERNTTAWASLVLVAQVLVRMCMIATTVSMISTSRSWRDDFLIDFCGVFAVSLVGIIVCLFLRVYCVVLAAFPSRFPTVLDYWNSTEYCVLLIAHTLLSMLLYYSSIMAGFRCGKLRYFYSQTPQTSGAGGHPSIYEALHLSTLRR